MNCSNNKMKWNPSDYDDIFDRELDGIHTAGEKARKNPFITWRGLSVPPKPHSALDAMTAKMLYGKILPRYDRRKWEEFVEEARLLGLREVGANEERDQEIKRRMAEVIVISDSEEEEEDWETRLKEAEKTLVRTPLRERKTETVPTFMDLHACPRMPTFVEVISKGSVCHDDDDDVLKDIGFGKKK